MTIGLDYLASYLKDGEGATLAEDKFFRGPELPIWQFIREYVLKFGELPSIELVGTEVPGVLLPVLTAGAGVHAYYWDKLRVRYQRQAVVDTVQAISDMTTAGEGVISVTAAQDLFLEALRKISATETGIHSAGEMVAAALKDKEDQVLGLKKVVKTPWAELNAVVTGVMEQDLFSYVAASSVGKSYAILLMADAAYEEQKAHTLLFSMEMGIYAVMNRLIAIRTKTPAGLINQGFLSTAKKLSIQAEFKEIVGKYITVVDSQLSSSVDDVVMHTQSMQPDLVVVDGAYLLTHPKAYGHERIKEVAETLKRDVAGGQNLPCIATWQLNSAGAKEAKKGKSAGKEEIGGSIAISQVSSVAIELTPTTHIDPNTGGEREVRRHTVIKNRDGPTGASMISEWDFKTMNFNSIVDDFAHG